MIDDISEVIMLNERLTQIEKRLAELAEEAIRATLLNGIRLPVDIIVLKA